MNEQQRHAYLDAMGIEQWLLRDSPVVSTEPAMRSDRKAEHPGFAVRGKADSGWLWVISDARWLESKLLRDIQKAVGDSNSPLTAVPVLEDSGADGANRLQTVITDCLVTRIVVFGKGLLSSTEARSIRQGSCQLLESAELAQIEGSREDKKTLWLELQKLMKT